MAGSPPRLLSIAGSDSGGGAGIQADLKAFAACGAHGMTAITAITAQNTVGVEAVEVLAPELILAQVRAVVRDIGVDAVKVGMIADIPTIAAVAEALSELPQGTPVVVDPVMVAESGARLLAQDAVEELRGLILPLATVATPNVPEARVLAGDAHSALPAHELARRVAGPANVVVTGGHTDELVDWFWDGSRIVAIPGERHPGGAAHGSGCTHSAALAAFLGHGLEPLEAARRAREVAGAAVRDGLRGLGAGAGPVDVLGVGARGAAVP